MKQALRLNSEFACYPTWIVSNDVRNISPYKLPISRAIAKEILEWDDKFQSTYNSQDPAKSRFETERDRQAFIAAGFALAKRIAASLPGFDCIVYTDVRGCKTHINVD